MSGRLPSDGMSHEPLPEPESEQLAALLGEGSSFEPYSGIGAIVS
jgi:hypothetical protein